MIDIVILWVNSEDKSWRNEYEKFSRLENRKIEGSIRYRDYGTLKYILRGIEKNASWFHKVHLILSDKTQIPDWLNMDGDKLEIHYHKEFIPVNLLPTFNSNVIEMYLHNIKSLSEYYILFNDDQFILNKLQPDMFVKNNLPVFTSDTKPLEFNLDFNNSFKQSLDNNLKFVINYCTKNKLNINKYKHAHLPECHKKSFEKKIIDGNKLLFVTSFIDSKFRGDKNFTNWLFSDLLQSSEIRVTNKNLYLNSSYVKLSDNIDFNQYKDKQLVCFNDNGNIDFERVIQKLNNFLERVYPNKSMFEK